MKAIIYTEPKKFDLKELDRPKCGENQVLIAVKACGVCKTDVHIHNGSFLSRFPLTPGHEFAGIVEETGAAVAGFKVGDRVVGDNTVLCGDCYYCRRNQPLYCDNFYSRGVNGPGGFAEYVIVNADKVFPIGDGLSLEEAAFTEPTACAVHGMDTIGVKPGDDVLLFGAGPTGIILAQLLKHGGAGNVLVAASTRPKLDIVEELEIGRAVLVDRNDYGRHEKEIKALYPDGFDIVIDATGAASITEQCVKFARKGAKIVVYGVCGEDDWIKVNPYEIFAKELKIIGSFAQTHCFDRALKFLKNRTVKVDRLVTHRFGLGEYGKALDAVMHSKGSLKVMINPDR